MIIPYIYIYIYPLYIPLYIIMIGKSSTSRCSTREFLPPNHSENPGVVGDADSAALHLVGLSPWNPGSDNVAGCWCHFFLIVI